MSNIKEEYSLDKKYTGEEKEEIKKGFPREEDSIDSSKITWVLKVSNPDHPKHGCVIGHTDGNNVGIGRSSGPSYISNIIPSLHKVNFYQTKEAALDRAPNIGFTNLEASDLEPVKIIIQVKEIYVST